MKGIISSKIVVGELWWYWWMLMKGLIWICRGCCQRLEDFRLRLTQTAHRGSKRRRKVRRLELRHAKNISAVTLQKYFNYWSKIFKTRVVIVTRVCAWTQVSWLEHVSAVLDNPVIRWLASNGPSFSGHVPATFSHEQLGLFVLHLSAIKMILKLDHIKFLDKF